MKTLRIAQTCAKRRHAADGTSLRLSRDARRLHTERVRVERASRKFTVTKFMPVVLAAAMLSATGVTTESNRESLQGVWQTVEVTTTGPAARTRTIPEPRANLTIFTANYYSRVDVQTEGLRPIPANLSTASADELRAVWGPFVAEAGTYDISGNQLTIRPIASKNPAAMGPGVFATYSYRLDGNTLWVTQERTQNGPFANPTTVKVVRID
jgi:hypothetical protein